MQIIPAIDLKNGKCVRLMQGDAARETVYSDRPVDVARNFASAGAHWVHIVDLDGAFDGVRHHTAVVTDIVAATNLRIELGGGIRSMDDIKACLDAGVSRVILGTAAHDNPDFVQRAVAAYGEAIAVGIDARGRTVALRGWVDQTATSVLDLARAVTAAHVRTLIYTDIAVDGMLAGPDCETLAELLSAVDADIIASGGIASRAHIRALGGLKPRPPAGCIIGKALYTGDLDLAEAIAAATHSPGPP
jgi:phosphoribosylformimino-5-aminoimidazole carboxamide ribotide isomerase